MAAKAAPLCSVQVGRIRLSYIPDGVQHTPPMSQFDNATEELWRRHGHLLDEEGWLILSIGALLVQTADRNVLIDLGWGPKSIDIGEVTGGEGSGDMVGGELLTNLARVGLAPADIDTVVFTHLHADHVGWAATDGPGGPVPTFPAAEHVVSVLEWDYWTDGPQVGHPVAPDDAQRAAIGERLTLVDDGYSPAPGIDLMATPGHTPGHCSVVVSSEGDRALVLGDAIHCPIEIAAPELDFFYDVDRVAARATKERIDAEIRQPGTITAGGHFPDLIFGRMMLGTAGPALHFLPGQIAVT
jgi:glyoxylase-like metal-dependent hydrolase (beta-lactamase superfamily II)